LAKTVIRPFRPTRKENSFLPLPSGVYPRRNVELNVVPGSSSQPKKRGKDGQRRCKRYGSRACPCAQAFTLFRFLSCGKALRHPLIVTFSVRWPNRLFGPHDGKHDQPSAKKY